MSESILIVVGAVGILGAGIGLGFWFSQRRMRVNSARADEIQRQFDDYRREVSQHFGQTAEHFKAIGREYRQLYEHMASGADTLCDRAALDTKLSFEPKAILESIDEEPATQPLRDSAQDDQPAEPEKEPVEALNTDAEAEDGQKSGRTLH